MCVCVSKAFDILDHKILLAKSKYYGMTGIPLDLFMSYLSNRKRYVDFKSIKSNTLDIKTGVPQGSILGRLLFIIFIKDLSKSSILSITTCVVTFGACPSTPPLQTLRLRASC